MHRMKTFCFENKNIDPYRGTQQKDTLDRQTGRHTPSMKSNNQKFQKFPIQLRYLPRYRQGPCKTWPDTYLGAYAM